MNQPPNQPTNQPINHPSAAGRRQPANQVLIHVRMLDKNAQAQAEALGILGVNLVHGALTKSGNHYDIIGGLMDDLDRSRVEVRRRAQRCMQLCCAGSWPLWSASERVRRILASGGWTDAMDE